MLLQNLSSTADLKTFKKMSAVALTQISAYGTHKNLAVRKIMEAMRTACAKSRIRSWRVSNYTWGKRSRKMREYCERKARIVCEPHFSISLNRMMAVKVLLKCAIHFSISLVRISEFLYANVSSTFRTVYAEAGATAECAFVLQLKSVCSCLREAGVSGHLGLFGVYYEADNSRLYVVCAKHVTEPELHSEFALFGPAQVKLNVDVAGNSKVSWLRKKEKR